MVLFLAGFLALLVGVTLGLLGGGGSILTLPLLVYLVGMEEKQGIASSLFVVAVTSMVALLSHAKAGRVHWRTGILFGLVGMAGAFSAGRIAAWIPGSYLLVGFGIVALSSALAMMRGRKETAPRDGPIPLAQSASLGLLVGGISGLVGAGGGFLIVPALTLLGGLAMADAIGTSLLVIALQAMAGFAGHATHVRFDWTVLGVVTGAAVVGSLLGSQLGRRLSALTLRRSFAWLILAMAIFILARETPDEILRMPALRAGGALALVFVIGIAIRNIRIGRALPKKENGTNSALRASENSASERGPRETDEMKIKTFYDPKTYTFTYVVYDENTKDAVVIDPVLDFDPLTFRTSLDSVDDVSNFIESERLKLHYVLETHAHADHLTGAQALKKRFGAKVAIGSNITEVQKTFKEIFDLGDDFATDGSQFDRLLDDGEVFEAGSLRIRVIFTPGHTPACASYHIGDAVFTGDALFVEDQGTGRTDFPKGSADALYVSIHEKLYELPDETRVFAGHDYQPGGREVRWETTIGESKARNVHLPAGLSKEEFVERRTRRDKELAAPRLLYPSLQVNIAAGRLPGGDRGPRFMKIPLNAGNPTDSAGFPQE